MATVGGRVVNRDAPNAGNGVARGDRAPMIYWLMFSGRLGSVRGSCATAGSSQTGARRSAPWVLAAGALALACFAAFPWARATAADDVPALVRRAVAEYAADHRGPLGFSRHVVFTLHAGPLSRDVRNDVGVLMRDGEYQRVRYYTGETNGKADDAAALQRQEDQANADIAAGRGFVKRPVDPRFLDDYRFATAACADCAVGREAFAFTSTVHDRQHGHGTIVIDAATGHVEQISYTLEQPPEHATSGDMTETFGEALPGLWTCVRVLETYHGRVGLIGGSASMTTTLDRFHRFPQLDTGLAALSAGSI